MTCHISENVLEISGMVKRKKKKDKKKATGEAFDATWRLNPRSRIRTQTFPFRLALEVFSPPPPLPRFFLSTSSRSYMLSQLTSPCLFFFLTAVQDWICISYKRGEIKMERLSQHNSPAIVNLNIYIRELDHINALLRSAGFKAVIFAVSPSVQSRAVLPVLHVLSLKIFSKGQIS